MNELDVIIDKLENDVSLNKEDVYMVLTLLALYKGHLEIELKRVDAFLMHFQSKDIDNVIDQCKGGKTTFLGINYADRLLNLLVKESD